MSENNKYIDVDTVTKITKLKQELDSEFKDWNAERLENYNAVAGKLLTQAEIDELKKDGRPTFVWNALQPLVTQIAGNYKNNMVSVETLPRTPDDIDRSEIMTKVLQFVLHQQNDLDEESVKSYIDAIIGRIGWTVQDWVWTNGEAKMKLKHYDPFRLLFDTKTKSRDLSDCRYLLDTAWYTVEEIQNIFAGEDFELFELLQEEAKKVLGRDPKTNKVGRWLDRIQGFLQRYVKDSKNIDSQMYLDDEKRQEHFNAERGLFEVVEFHERRQQMKYTLFDVVTSQLYDITDEIMTDGKVDAEKLKNVKAQFTMPLIQQSVENKIYVTTVVPALNIKLLEAPYPIEMPDFNFKYTPTFSFDYHPDLLEMKSLVDGLKDSARAYTKHLNTMQEMLARMKKQEIWIERSAAGDYAEDLQSNKIGSIKIVEDGTITQSRVKEFSTNPNLTPFQNMSLNMLEFMKFNSGVRDNAMGTRENANESGTLFSQRVAQTDIMQEYINENAQASIFQIAKKTIGFIQKYMTEEQIIRITTDEGDIEFMKINEKTIFGIKNDITVGEYDLIISKAPYGRAAKDQEFQKLMMLIQQIAQIDPTFLIQNYPTIIKASGTSFTKELLESFNKYQEEKQGQAQQQVKMMQQ